MRWLPRAVLGLAIATLSACALQPQRPGDADPAAWRAHRDQVAALEQWRLSGRMALRTEDDAYNASVDWIQSGARYEIKLTAPFGQGGMRLRGDRGYSELTLADDGTVVAADPETLLARELGWHLPVAGLRYWVLGLPDPRADKQWVLDEAGRISRLQQEGWEIDFRRYMDVNGVDLPGKVFITHPRMQVRLVVDRWDVNA